MTTGAVKEDKKYLLSFLLGARQQVVEEFGGESKMSPRAIILLDRVIAKLGCLRLIEIHAEKKGVIKIGTLSSRSKKVSVIIACF